MLVLCPHCNRTFIQMRRKVKGATMQERFMQFVNVMPSGCHIWGGGHTGRGYPVFNHGGKSLYAHRVALEMKLGRPIKQGMEALHKCPGGGDPMCVNPDHLKEDTHAENMRDRSLNGHPRCWGEHTRTAKLTEAQVLEIRKRWPGPLTMDELGMEYRVTKMTIWSIVSGRTWKHLLPERRMEERHT